MSTPYVGEIRMFGFNRTPVGWLPCDGSLVPIAQFDVLFALIGTTYGGDGQTTFGLPDLRGRVPIHQGQGPGLSNYVIGQNGGTETVTLTTGQIPSHAHVLSVTTAAATAITPGTGSLPGAVSGDTYYTSDPSTAIAVPLSSQAAGPAGGSQPHANLMPTLPVQFCIATEGIFPSPA